MARLATVRFRTITARRWTVSLVELRRSNRSEAVSGGAMDRVVERKRLDRRIVIGGAAAAVISLVLLFWLFAPRAGFDVGQPRPTGDFRGPIRHVRRFPALARDGSLRSSPSISTRSRAVASTRNWSRTARRSTAGQLLAVLSNAELQLSTLEKQAEVEQQLNNMRSQELALTQTHNTNLRDLNQAETDLAKARRQYDLYKPLADKGFVAMKTFNDTKDDLELSDEAPGRF